MIEMTLSPLDALVMIAMTLSPPDAHTETFHVCGIFLCIYIWKITSKKLLF